MKKSKKKKLQKPHPLLDYLFRSVAIAREIRQSITGARTATAGSSSSGALFRSGRSFAGVVCTGGVFLCFDGTQQDLVQPRKHVSGVLDQPCRDQGVVQQLRGHQVGDGGGSGVVQRDHQRVAGIHLQHLRREEVPVAYAPSIRLLLRVSPTDSWKIFLTVIYRDGATYH
jgi:hypothetical protein